MKTGLHFLNLPKNTELKCDEVLEDGLMLTNLLLLILNHRVEEGEGDNHDEEDGPVPSCPASAAASLELVHKEVSDTLDPAATVREV